MDINELPTDLEQFVQQEIANGNYQSTDDLVAEAVRMLRKYKQPNLHDAAEQAFSEDDPLTALIGSFEDAASDVSQDKSRYLADTYDRQ